MRRWQQGFTVIELMVTVAVVAILAAIAYPSFTGVIRSNRISGVANEFTASVAYARSEAIRSRRGAGICPANANGTACGGTSDWSLGWLVWADTNANNAYNAGTDTLLRYVQPQAQMAINVASSAAGAQSIVFSPTGRPLDNPSSGRAVTVTSSPCPAGEPLVRTLTLNVSGQLSTVKGTCTQ